jgi:hypothetical protein
MYQFKIEDTTHEQPNECDAQNNVLGVGSREGVKEGKL